MAVTSTPAFPQSPKNYKVQILPADTSTLKTLVTGGANGTKIVNITVASTDTSARDVQFGITTGGTFFPIGTVTIPITAGTIAATAAINLMATTLAPSLPLDSDGNPFILLSSASDTLQVKSLTTVTAAKELDITAFGADF
jgi:hypothetical protein